MANKLKIDFHTHTAEDPKDYINYSSFRLIDRAAGLGFDGLAVSNHNTVTYSAELAAYAEKKDILLIPATEVTFSAGHVLIVNPILPDLEGIVENRPLEDLARWKNDHSLIIAPHPFYFGFRSIKSALFDYLTYFDAIEFSCFHNHLFNLNRKAVALAAEMRLPLIGTSDAHNLWQFGSTYTLVEADKEVLSVVDAVREGRVEVWTSAMSLLTMSRVMANFILSERLRLRIKI